MGLKNGALNRGEGMAIGCGACRGILEIRFFWKGKKGESIFFTP